MFNRAAILEKVEILKRNWLTIGKKGFTPAPITDKLRAVEIFDDAVKMVHHDILKDSLNSALEPLKMHVSKNPTKKEQAA